MVRSSSFAGTVYITEIIGLSVCTTSKGQEETQYSTKTFKLLISMIFLDLIIFYCLRDDYQSLSCRRFTIHGSNLMRFSS